jgi:type I restriction enzyme S subunit
VRELPPGWTYASVRDLIAEGGVLADGDWVESKDQDPEGDVRLVQLADIGDGTFLDRSSRFLTSTKAVALHCTKLKKGDILIARMPHPLGRACIFPGSPRECVTVVDVCILRPGKVGPDARWLMYTINAPQMRLVIAGLQSGSTRQRISRTNLAGIPIPVPPLPEQRSIVTKIETHLAHLDAAVDHLAGVNQKLTKCLEGILSESLTSPVEHTQQADNELSRRIRAKRMVAGGPSDPLPPDNSLALTVPRGGSS